MVGAEGDLLVRSTRDKQFKYFALPVSQLVVLGHDGWCSRSQRRIAGGMGQACSATSRNPAPRSSRRARYPSAFKAAAVANSSGPSPKGAHQDPVPRRERRLQCARLSRVDIGWDDQDGYLAASGQPVDLGEVGAGDRPPLGFGGGVKLPTTAGQKDMVATMSTSVTPRGRPSNDKSGTARDASEPHCSVAFIIKPPGLNRNDWSSVR
jgi:hypothetical protein